MKERERVTITLPRDLLESVDRLAKDKAMSRSAMIAELLEEQERARLEAWAAEGYREFAEENARIAEEFLDLDREMMRRIEWNEVQDG